MADSRLHKLKGKWNNGVIPLCSELWRMFCRHNFDLGEERADRIKLKERIAKREMKRELESLNE